MFCCCVALRLDDEIRFTRQNCNLPIYYSDYEQMDTNSRLTSSNFYKMFKLMLQIEDENDSKRSLHYDQCERDVTHEFGLRYSMKIVSYFVV